jgi:hypothetical protein
MNRFYVLDEPSSMTSFKAEISLSRRSGLLVPRGEECVREPVAAKWCSGRRWPADVIWTGYVAGMLLSDKAFRVLKDCGAGGWKTYGVDLRGSSEEAIPGYAGLVIVGRCGPIEDARSQRVERIFPGGVFPVWKGVYFDQASWDGSYLFMPRDGTGWIFCTENVKRALEKEEIGNIAFRPQEEVERTSLVRSSEPIGS